MYLFVESVVFESRSVRVRLEYGSSTVQAPVGLPFQRVGLINSRRYWPEEAAAESEERMSHFKVIVCSESLSTGENDKRGAVKVYTLIFGSTLTPKLPAI